MTMQFSRLGKCREAVVTSPTRLRVLGIVIWSIYSTLVSKLVISYPFRRVESSEYDAYYSNPTNSCTGGAASIFSLRGWVQ